MVETGHLKNCPAVAKALAGKEKQKQK